MSAVDSALLQVRGLKVHYRNVQAVHGIDLDVREGEVVAVLGANGAGKSSIIKALMGLVPSSGEVQFGGAPLAGTSAKRVEGRDWVRRVWSLQDRGRLEERRHPRRCCPDKSFNLPLTYKSVVISTQDAGQQGSFKFHTAVDLQG